MIWIAWALLLVIQNASFTWVSRARNSGSLAYHGVAAVFSNGIWIVSQAVIINLMFSALQSGDVMRIALTCSFYTTFTVIGSITAHHVLRTYVEVGKRKVGA